MTEEKKEEHKHEDHKHAEVKHHEHKEHSQEHKVHSLGQHEPHPKSRIKFENVIIAVAALLGIVLLFTNFSTFALNKELKAKLAETAEKARPGRIELSIIKDSKCRDCFDINKVVSLIKSSKANVTKESTLEPSSSEAKSLISKYGLQKLPAVVITGEVDKVSIEGLEKKDDAILFKDAPAPFINASNGKLQGLVNAYLIKDSKCTKCADLNNLLQQIKTAGMKTGTERTLDSSSDEGKALLDKYRISSVPSLILSKDAAYYPIIRSAWAQVGSVEKDGSYVVREPYPPFINLTTGELKGLISVIYLGDKSCTSCYDVMKHQNILTGKNSFALNFENEDKLDISDPEGRQLLTKYNITQVPTVLITGDIRIYPSAASLKQFFSEEKDGTFVFRNLRVVGTYKDLPTGEIIEPQQEQ